MVRMMSADCFAFWNLKGWSLMLRCYACRIVYMYNLNVKHLCSDTCVCGKLLTLTIDAKLCKAADGSSIMSGL